MKKYLLATAFCAIGFLSCTKADDDGHDHSMTTHADSAASHTSVQPAAGSGGSMEERMTTMNTEMVQHLGPADADYDHRLIDMMITHHEGAVMMAKDALQKSQRPEIKKLAQDVIDTQEKEIALLKSWGEQWYHKH